MLALLFGPRAHQRVVHYLNGAILMAFRVAGTRISFKSEYEIKQNQPVIIIANHQSLWDIVGIYWYMRGHFPLFVSKIELAKGVPSISYNLRKSGSALIDRKDKKQSIAEILKLGTKIKNESRAAVIFPEGTRSRDGQLKRFAYGGVTGLLKKCPNAMVVPLVIKGTAELQKNNYFLIKMGKKISYEVLKPFETNSMTPQEVVEKSQTSIKNALGQ